jgi:tetratricopeptide (TPR) repeat protein
MKPTLFIGSSKESLDIAYAVQQNLYQDSEITVWPQGIFELSSTAIDSLLKRLDTFDFSVFVFSPDDITFIRNEENKAVRDNVLLEIGLFIGRLGLERCFILSPEDDAELRIPTDLIGLTRAKYETARSDANLQAATGPACTSIRTSIARLGHRNAESEAPLESPKRPEQTLKEQTLEKAKTASEETGEQEDFATEYHWLFLYLDKEYAKSLEQLAIKITEEQDIEQLANLESWKATIQYNQDPTIGTGIFDEVFGKFPKSHYPYLTLSEELIKNNRHAECLVLLDGGLDEVKDKLPLIRKKSECLQKMGEQEDAITVLNKYLTQFADTYELYFDLSKLYLEKQDYKLALSCLHEGLKYNPNNRLLMHHYARLLYDHFDMKLSLIPYNKLVELAPEDPEYRTLRGNAYLELELNDLAIYEYKEADKMAGHKQSWIIANIGNLLNNRGLHSEAIPNFNLAIELTPDYQYAHERLARAIKLRSEQSDKLKEIEQDAMQQLAQFNIDEMQVK